MDIIIRDGFRFANIQGKEMLLLESRRIPEYMEYARANGITDLSVQGYHNYGLDNVDFLKDNDFFTSLYLERDIVEINISAIHHLQHLRELIVSNEGQSIDFFCFPEIESASMDWNNNLIHLYKCPRLNSLILRKYKPRSGAFGELSGISQLSSLEITQSSINSFSGLSGLISFKAHWLSKLTSLDGFEIVSRTLRTLELQTCKKLTDYEPILEKLTALEKLILSDCGPMKSLGFIKKMKALQFFSFVGTNVLDGDLRPLIDKRLVYAGFDDKRHYSHKMKEIVA